ncbi:MAG TPA: hypothetical protein VGI40_11895 [Pirellulaceae bacterium]
MIAWHEYFSRARAAMALKRWELAHEHILQALADAPDHSLLHATRAEICYRLEHYAESRIAAREAIQRDPDQYYGYYWLAWSLMADLSVGANHGARAMEVAGQALNCSPNEPDCYYVRAMTARFVGDSRAALAFATSGLQIDPEHVGCLDTLARAQMELGIDRDAEDTWCRLLQRNPESVDAHTEMARIALRASRFAEAYQHASTAIRQQPNSTTIRELYKEVVGHQHPLARFFLWSAKLWQENTQLCSVPIVVIVCTLFLLLPQVTDKRIRAVLAVAAFFFCLGLVFYGAWAIVAAETIIAHSSRFSKLVPETRALRSVYAFAWIAVLILILALLLSAALLNAHPFLLAGNAVMIGFVELIARWAPDKRRGFAARFAMIIPVTLEALALFGSFSEEITRASMVILGWCATTVAALIIADLRV